MAHRRPRPNQDPSDRLQCPLRFHRRYRYSPCYDVPGRESYDLDRFSFLVDEDGQNELVVGTSTHQVVAYRMEGDELRQKASWTVTSKVSSFSPLSSLPPLSHFYGFASSYQFVLGDECDLVKGSMGSSAHLGGHEVFRALCRDRLQGRAGLSESQRPLWRGGDFLVSSSFSFSISITILILFRLPRV